MRTQEPATFNLQYEGYTLQKCKKTNPSLPGNNIDVTVKYNEDKEIEFNACFVDKEATLIFAYIPKRGYLKYKCFYVD